MIIGLDVGGTHIDAVVIKNKIIIKSVKREVDSNNLFNSIWGTIKELILNIDKTEITKINLSTTISTNAIVEGNTSKVGLIIQSGPGLPNEYYEIGDRNIFLSGYTDHRGTIVKNYLETEIKNGVEEFNKVGIKHVGIITKFSTRNSKTEKEIKESIKSKFTNITLGHEVSGRLNFPRRINTVYLNESVYDVFNDFANNITLSFKKEGINVPISILKADGGIMSLNSATKKPVESILSGPSASLMGITSLIESKEDAILLDIGGTTTDIFFLADGVPLFEPQGIQIDKYKTLVRSIFSKSIGLGGDSEVSFKEGMIKIGPRRQGRPLGLGGPSVTPTDAFISLGLLNIGNKDLSIKGIEVLAKGLNKTVDETAKLIISEMSNTIKNAVDKALIEINSKPVYTIKELLEAKRITPKEIHVIGGPAKILSKSLSEKFGLRVNYPKNYEIVNAIGAALAKTTAEINLLADTNKRVLIIPELSLLKNISSNYNLNDATNDAFKYLEEIVRELGDESNLDSEITEQQVFNMIDGFYTKGKNIRLKAQIKPGLIYRLKGDNNED